MESNSSIIRLFNVSKRYGAKYALKDVSLEIQKGEFVFLNGPTGAGKSTLLKMLYLAETVSEGQIIVNGMNLARISRPKLALLRRRFGMIFQDYKLISNRTVFDNIALVLEAAGQKPGYIRKKVMHMLRITNMEKKVHSYPPMLSGGEQQRVAVARAMAGNPSIILADEPTGSLDADAAQATMDFIMKYHEKGATVIIASHDIQLISRTVKARSVLLKDGIVQKTARML